MATCLLVWVQLTAFGPGDEPPTAALPAAASKLPRPDLSAMEPAAREQIERQLARLDSLVAAGSFGGLGTAAGELGQLYHAYGLEQEAAVCYREAELLDPDERRWPYYLGFLHQIRGEPGDAASAFERALRRGPDDPATLVRLARARFDSGEIEAADALFRDTLQRHPEAAAAALAGLARIATARGEHAAAAESYQAALALQPTATRLHYPLGLALRELGEIETAKEHLAQRGDRPVAFPDPLAAALDRRAVGSALHINRAGIALAEGRTQEALREYRQAVASDPDNATARGELGMLLAAGGDLGGARRELEVARRLEPENPTHVEALARVLAADGAEERALPLFRRAVELDPGRAPGHLHLAAALARAGRYVEARASFDRTLELDPSSSAARLGRAEVLLELDRPAAAATDLEAVLRSEPANARASLRLGEARQRLGESQSAVEAFEQALDGELDTPERVAALLGVGNLLAGRGDLEPAVERYLEVLALAPGLDQAEFNLAGALAMLGREEEAIVHYSALLTRRPADLQVRAYRARLLLGRGRADAALRDFDYILGRQPDAPEAHLGVAAALGLAGRWSEARRRLEGSLGQLPGEPALTAALARLLASCPDPAMRDGARAIGLVQELIAADSSPDHAETLAMALAETGRHGEAAELQRKLLAAARAGGAPPGVVSRLESNLALYEAGSPCCASPPS